MEDLTGQYQDKVALAPSSMEAGNLTTPPEQVALTMTAPGSQPVTPMPDLDECSQLPRPVLGEVYDPPNRVAGNAGTGHGGTWVSVSGARWPA